MLSVERGPLPVGLVGKYLGEGYKLPSGLRSRPFDQGAGPGKEAPQVGKPMDGAGWFSGGNRAEIVRAILTPKG